MPAISKRQRRFFGLVRALQKGQVSPKEVGEEARIAARKVGIPTAREFAGTRRKGLPESISALRMARKGRKRR